MHNKIIPQNLGMIHFLLLTRKKKSPIVIDYQGFTLFFILFQ